MTEYEKQLRKALRVKFNFEDETITVREYLHKLLETLWIEGEGFSSKRPFGNSGWENDLIIPLVKAGFVEGKRSLGSSGRSRLAVTDSDWPSSGAASGTDFPDSLNETRKRQASSL